MPTKTLPISPRPTRKRSARKQGSERQIIQANAAQRVRLFWYSLTPAQQGAFARLGPLLPDWNGTRGGRPLRPFQAFQVICAARMAAHLPLLPDAPQIVDLPPSPGKLTLVATAGANGRTLRLVPDVLYPCACQIWGAKPQMQGTESVPKGKFLVIASCPSLPPEGVDLLAGFTAASHPFQVGHRLFLRVCPVSLSGFRGQPVVVDGIVGEE